MSSAAELLLTEERELAVILARTPPAAFDRPTICSGWSVRDVLAHCGAALTRAASGELHRFRPEDNERDVAERRGWALADVIDELRAGYRDAAEAIEAAGGALDGIAIGEWIHGGDVREALGEPDPYASPGIELAIGLLEDRSRLRKTPPVEGDVSGRRVALGVAEAERPSGSLTTDEETFVRLLSGRRPEPSRYRLVGADPEELVLFD